MKELNPIAIINKYKVWIIVISLIAGLAFAWVLNQNQSYTATAIIQYTNEQAEQGLAPDGTEIDTSEIYSAEVMKEVFARMGLSYSDYNLDRFRSKVAVTPVLSSEEAAVQEGKAERGEEYELEPTKYMITLTLDKKDAADPEIFARRVMDHMLDVFQRIYAEKHVGSSVVVNDIVTLAESNYDYIEAIEAVEARVTETMQSLNNYVINNSTFRSVTTGYSFGDLYREFALLLDNEIPEIYAFILENRVTKNQDVLMAKYQQRIEDYNIDLESSSREIKDIKQIIETYVEMMRQSDNTDITYEYILNQVHDSYYQDPTTSTWKKPDETVEYDVLLENYIKNRLEYEYAVIDVAYCQYILDTFRESRDDQGGASSLTASGSEDEMTLTLNLQDSRDLEKLLEELMEQIETLQGQVSEDSEWVPFVLTEGQSGSAGAVAEAMISVVMGKLDVLYERLSDVRVEYSEYAGAQNVGPISNIIVNENLKILLYSGVAMVAFALLLSLAVILLGRMGEIFDYYMYMDHKLLVPNRNGCDRYLKKHKKNMLPRDFVCISLNVTDIRQKNEIYGREACDNMLAKMVDILRKVFPGEPNGFLALNSFGQFVIFLSGITEIQGKAYMEYVLDEVERYNADADCPIEYRWGLSESEKDNIFMIHNLMVTAINRAGSGEAVTVKK